MERDREIAEMEKIMALETQKENWIQKLNVAKMIESLKTTGQIEVARDTFFFKRLMAEDFIFFIPSDFELMGEDQINRKYPYTQRADYIFSDETTRRTINFNPFEEITEDSQFYNFTNGVLSGFRKLHPEMTLISEENGMTDIGLFNFFDTILPSIDEEIYLFFGMVHIHNKIAFFSFSTPSSEGSAWQKICGAMLQTIDRQSKEEN